jgi:hypothetical protein
MSKKKNAAKQISLFNLIGDGRPSRTFQNPNQTNYDYCRNNQHPLAQCSVAIGVMHRVKYLQTHANSYYCKEYANCHIVTPPQFFQTHFLRYTHALIEAIAEGVGLRVGLDMVGKRHSIYDLAP